MTTTTTAGHHVTTTDCGDLGWRWDCTCGASEDAYLSEDAAEAAAPYGQHTTTPDPPAPDAGQDPGGADNTFSDATRTYDDPDDTAGDEAPAAHGATAHDSTREATITTLATHTLTWRATAKTPARCNGCEWVGMTKRAHAAHQTDELTGAHLLTTGSAA